MRRGWGRWEEVCGGAGGRGGGGVGGQMAKEGAEVRYVGLSKCGVRHYDDVCVQVSVM